MKESERKRQKLKDEYESIVSERDILGIIFNIEYIYIYKSC
jgi:hypothetical protein